MSNWDLIQRHAVLSYVNSLIAEQVELSTLTSGQLIQILEILAKKKCVVKASRMTVTTRASRIQEIETANTALKFARENGVRLVSVEAGNIVNHDEFTLVSLFVEAIKKFKGLSKFEMRDTIAWVREKTQLQMNNFVSDWADGFLMKFLFASETPFEKFQQFGICQVVEEKNMGKEEFSMILQIKLIYEKFNEINEDRDTMPHLNDQMTKLYEIRNVELQKQHTYVNDVWQPVEIKTNDNEEKLNKEKEEAELKEKERIAKEEKERLEKEAERLENERLAKEEQLKKEEERLQQEKLAKEEAERIEKERLIKEEQLKKEEERLQHERAEKEEAERLEKERLAQEEADKKAFELAEKQRVEEEAKRLQEEKAAQEEEERVEKERREEERLHREEENPKRKKPKEKP
ncbi:Tropomyosin-1, putative [Entamoeba invadens IP1]|uniref:Tropomyosin-1, putative n=1 Tax=Entamoeba invadens IP1 TaxID=370355 RepID=UPI0002C3F65C|nr:Tropomyosin-1, putative [Entamoeba invadens IP1]ELP90395.1 Tropomyosin-1, putative [Entamoeba invadens IP1]|eukprot:XP_004257166.1 Tropomyosin-1, putative [Entamoeba invadens IP1]